MTKPLAPTNVQPETATGRKNRERYCEPTEAEKAKFIAGLDAALAELAKESGIDFDNGNDEDKPKAKWPF